MDQADAQRVVEEINTYLRRQPWFDFQILSYAGDRLQITGGLSLSYSPHLEIVFSSVRFISATTDWRSDTSQPLLSLVTGDAFGELNRQFEVYQGNHVFRFQPEDHVEGFGCLIGAERIEYQIFRDSAGTGP